MNRKRILTIFLLFIIVSSCFLVTTNFQASASELKLEDYLNNDLSEDTGYHYPTFHYSAVSGKNTYDLYIVCSYDSLSNIYINNDIFDIFNNDNLFITVNMNKKFLLDDTVSFNNPNEFYDYIGENVNGISWGDFSFKDYYIPEQQFSLNNVSSSVSLNEVISYLDYIQICLICIICFIGVLFGSRLLHDFSFWKW